MKIKCFLLSPTDRVQESLRRYASGSQCSVSGMGYHNADVVIGEREASANDCQGDRHPHDDHRWPTQCACGYAFTEADQWVCHVYTLYRASDTGRMITLRAAPVGAMWFAPWMSDSPEYQGPDGQTLVVRCPGNHDWIIDSRANNCGSPCAKCGKPYRDHAGGLCAPIPPGTPYDRDQHYYADAVPQHKCWVRHGVPPDVHVDKNGSTCDAGGGSILYPGFHGFLHHGHITNC